MNRKHVLNAQQAAWLADTKAARRAQFGGFFMEAAGGDAGGNAGQGDAGDNGDSGGDQTFTQADVDRILADRLKRERESTKAKYADYDDLKKAAEGKKTADDRLAELEKKYADADARAMRADIASRHGITPEDRDLFLTASDAETLEAQAKRLADRQAELQQRNNLSPREGTKPATKASDEREFARGLFGGGS